MFIVCFEGGVVPLSRKELAKFVRYIRRMGARMRAAIAAELRCCLGLHWSG